MEAVQEVVVGNTRKDSSLPEASLEYCQHCDGGQPAEWFHGAASPSTMISACLLKECSSPDALVTPQCAAQMASAGRRIHPGIGRCGGASHGLPPSCTWGLYTRLALEAHLPSMVEVRFIPLPLAHVCLLY